MKLIEVMNAQNAPEYRALREKFPEMYRLAADVEVIHWRDEFNVADRNPEQAELLQNLDRLLKEGKISQEEYAERTKELHGYTSRTMAVAFIEKRQIAFRDPDPTPYLVIHELGHIHFGVNDLFWNTQYGGGEVLLWLALDDRFRITEKHIREYHALIQRTYDDPDAVHGFIAGRIAHRIGVFPHLFPIQLHMGCFPMGLEFGDEADMSMIRDTRSPRWAEFTVGRYEILSFFQNLIEGLKWAEPFCVAYAEWLGIIEK